MLNLKIELWLPLRILRIWRFGKMPESLRNRFIFLSPACAEPACRQAGLRQASFLSSQKVTKPAFAEAPAGREG
ncbi:MAG: hypothetical protein JXB49_06215 [Bacteroidales bacterium]|nr:hypothetical protein [Bacteroidales bacterium]